MTIQEFLTLHQLRIAQDECDEEIIPGKLGQIFDHDSGRLGLVLEDACSGVSRARLLLSHRRLALKAGFKLIQEGACESTLLFDPNNPEQARLAIRLVGARRKRSVRSSPASLQNLVKTPTHMPLHAVETTQSQGMTLLT